MTLMSKAMWVVSTFICLLLCCTFVYYDSCKQCRRCYLFIGEKRRKELQQTGTPWIAAYRRLADGTVHCAGSATYQICFRLPVPNLNPNLNPNPKTDPNPNPNPKSNNNVRNAKRHPNKVQDSVINISYFCRAGGRVIKGL